MPALAAAAPGPTIVVDHLGKPPFDDAFADGETQLRAAAGPARVAAKVFGLWCRRVWEQTLELVQETDREAILGANALRIYELS